ncbi:MAG: hypothetical protein MRY81_11815 [Donghicola eburneus]|nr:hypothetical protein [Donghicola eburneus]MCI5040355.1 hypothetical protein [Donghicola eburneus]
MILLHEDPYLRVVQYEGRGRAGRVLLSFTGVGHAMGGIDVQQPEFFGTGQDFDSTIFITDKTRSWGNAFDMKLLPELLAPVISDREIYGIGNSMGGYLALLVSGFIRLHTVIAFAPQYSVDPVIAPWEPRWRKYLAEINRHINGPASAYLTSFTTYYLFSAGQGPDLRHARSFPVQANLFHFVFPGFAHNVAGVLKERGELSSIIHDCFAGRARIRSTAVYEQLSPNPLT